MAFIVKHAAKARVAGPNGSGFAYLNQNIQVSRAAKALPQSTTQQLFRVFGGRILVHLLIGEVTTVIEGTDPVLKVSAERLADDGTLVGTVYDIASTLDMSSDEVGTIYTVEGDGTAIVSPQLAGAGFAAQGIQWIMPQGAIYITTGASKTGAIKWDLFYQPLDPGAFATAVDIATVKV